MGRIVVPVKITNLFDEDKFIQCEMFVDTEAGALILPKARKEKLGDFKRSEPVELQLANQEVVCGEACWPVEIKIDSFRPAANEVISVDMGLNEDNGYEPLLGYVILEQAQVAVDMLGHSGTGCNYPAIPCEVSEGSSGMSGRETEKDWRIVCAALRGRSGSRRRRRPWSRSGNNRKPSA